MLLSFQVISNVIWTLFFKISRLTSDAALIDKFTCFIVGFGQCCWFVNWFNILLMSTLYLSNIQWRYQSWNTTDLMIFIICWYIFLLLLLIWKERLTSIKINFLFRQCFLLRHWTKVILILLLYRVAWAISLFTLFMLNSWVMSTQQLIVDI